MACKIAFPQNLVELNECLHTFPENSRILCGGTDLIIALHTGRVQADALIDVSGVSEMREICLENSGVLIGGGCVFSQITASSILKPYHCLIQAADGVGSPQIRNKGSIAGSLANGSAAGDMHPALLVLDAVLHILDKSGQNKQIPIEEFSAKDLMPTQVITHLEIPSLPTYSRTAFGKLGNRREVTIARIDLAIRVDCDHNGSINRAYVALGAVGRQAFRSLAAEDFLQGRHLEEQLEMKLADILASEIEHSIPGRSSLPYKRRAIYGLTQDVWTKLLQN